MQKRGRLSGVRIVSRGLLEDNPEARKGAAAQDLLADAVPDCLVRLDKPIRIPFPEPLLPDSRCER